MADETVKSSGGSAEEKSTSPRKVVLPNNAVAVVKHLDRLILRLNKLLSTPSGLSAFLSTSNYILYILAYLQPKAPSLSSIQQKLLALLRLSAASSTKLVVSDSPAVPSFAALALLLSKCRTTLRLLGCFPLYGWLRMLLAGSKPGADPVLHRVALLQAGSYFTYQIMENVCVLADHDIIPKSFVARLNRGSPTTARLYLIAYRFWLAGVSCDFLRLAREAQLERKKRAARGSAAAAFAEEDARVDRRWWIDLVIAGAWFPMALHYSSSSGGLPGWNVGWMGVCGLVAGGERIRGLWKATA